MSEAGTSPSKMEPGVSESMSSSPHHQPITPSPRFERLPSPAIADTESDRPITPVILIDDFDEEIIDNAPHGPSDNSRNSFRNDRDGTRTPEKGNECSPLGSAKAISTAQSRRRLDVPLPDVGSDLEQGAALAMSVSHRSHQNNKAARSSRSGGASGGGPDNNQNIKEEEFPTSGAKNRRYEGLHIDFEFLEHFVIREQLSYPNDCQHLTKTPRAQDIHHQKTNTGIPAAASGGELLNVSRRKQSVKPREIYGTDQSLYRNRFSFFSTAKESTIHASELAYLVEDGESIKSLFEQTDDRRGVWWLDSNYAKEEEVQGLCTAFGIHPLTIEDIITHESHEKIELFSSYYFASFQTFRTLQHDNRLEYESFSIYLIVFREGVLSFSFVPNSHASSVRQKIAALEDYISLSSDWICYAIIDNIVDIFGPAIRHLEQNVDSIDDSVFIMRERDSREFLKNIGTARKNCSALIRLIGGKADVLRGFTKRCNENYPIAPHTEVGIYLSDIQDHVVTMAANIIHFEQILARAHSNYLATVSTLSISQGNSTNRMLNKITLLASIVVPLNLVGAIFGMNVQVPFASQKNLGAFFGIIGFMVLFTSFMLGLGRYYRLI